MSFPTHRLDYEVVGAPAVQLRIAIAGGQDRVVDLPLEPGQTLTALELTVDGAPVVRIPLAFHEPGYHTICRRDLDEIDQLYTG